MAVVLGSPKGLHAHIDINTNGDALIPASAVGNGLNYYDYGRTQDLLVLQDDNGIFRTAYNVCEECLSKGNSHYTHASKLKVGKYLIFMIYYFRYGLWVLIFWQVFCSSKPIILTLGGIDINTFSMKSCVLCGASPPLELSHIIPKFIYRYFKETFIGALRCADNPNVTIQDGEKHYMLYSTCGDLFSIYEKQFVDLVFHPYMKQGIKTFSYDK